MHEKALCRQYGAATWQDQNGTRTASWVAVDENRTHVVRAAEDNSLSTFAGNRADMRPIFCFAFMQCQSEALLFL